MQTMPVLNSMLKGVQRKSHKCLIINFSKFITELFLHSQYIQGYNSEFKAVTDSLTSKNTISDALTVKYVLTPAFFFNVYLCYFCLRNVN